MKAILSMCAVAVALLAAAPSARACPYGSFVIVNPSNVTLPFQVKFGDGGTWEDYSVPPNTRYAIYFNLDENGRAPTPYIRFDCSPGANKLTIRSYRLDFYAVSDPHKGKGYVFHYSADGRYLDLNEE
jgi:hypothetical protein